MLLNIDGVSLELSLENDRKNKTAIVTEGDAIRKGWMQVMCPCSNMCISATLRANWFLQIQWRNLEKTSSNKHVGIHLVPTIRNVWYHHISYIILMPSSWAAFYRSSLMRIDFTTPQVCFVTLEVHKLPEGSVPRRQHRKKLLFRGLVRSPRKLYISIKNWMEPYHRTPK